MAPLVACHAIHSSGAPLASALRAWNPLVMNLENGVDLIPRLETRKHLSKFTRVFIGNQNRKREHAELVLPLRSWLAENPNVIAVIVGDRKLAERIGITAQIELHPLLEYQEYRDTLKKCHIALLPLQKGNPERCKTVIKWAEASAESVAVVAGPELYPSISKNHRGETTCSIGVNTYDIVSKARELSEEKDQRLQQVIRAHEWVKKDWGLDQLLPQRIDLYNSIWQKREKIDDLLKKRLFRQQTSIGEGFLDEKK